MKRLRSSLEWYIYLSNGNYLTSSMGCKYFKLYKHFDKGTQTLIIWETLNTQWDLLRNTVMASDDVWPDQ